jgi:pilus assembly protein CpaB
MRLKSVLLIVVALVIAGVTAYMVRNWLDAERAAAARALANRPQAPQPVGMQVLVAKRDLPVGTFLRPEHLRWQAWPEASVSPAYAVEGKKRMEDFVGAVVRLPIANGEPITEGRVVSPGNSGFLAAVLRPGYRAVSVPVTMTSGISGFVFPGDHVDILLTHAMPQTVDGGLERRAGLTVLRDIRVLALDQKLDIKPGEAAVPRTATIEVTPKQSEMVAVVVEMGKLSLSLRSLARDEPLPPESDPFQAVDLKAGDVDIKTGDNGKTDLPALPDRSFTLDSEVSSLLSVRRVTIMRGSKAEEMRVSP